MHKILIIFSILIPLNVYSDSIDDMHVKYTDNVSGLMMKAPMEMSKFLMDVTKMTSAQITDWNKNNANRYFVHGQAKVNGVYTYNTASYLNGKIEYYKKYGLEKELSDLFDEVKIENTNKYSHWVVAVNKEFKRKVLGYKIETTLNFTSENNEFILALSEGNQIEYSGIIHRIEAAFPNRVIVAVISSKVL